MRLHASFVPSETQRIYAQTDFSAQPAPSRQNTRIPGPDEDPRRPEGTVSQEAEGTAPAVRQTGVQGIETRWPKSVRLLRRSDFQRVYDTGRRFNSPFFTAFSAAGTGPGPRVGFTTSRALGKAVRRNRLRRRLREAVRQRFGELGACLDVVFNPRSAVYKAAFREIEAEVKRYFAGLKG